MSRTVTKAGGHMMLAPMIQNLLLGSILLQVPLALWAALDDSGRGAMVWVAWLCLAAIGFPLLVRGSRLNPLEPIVWCTVAVAIGTTLRSIYVSFSSYFRADFLMFGQTYWDVAGNGAWVVLSLVCLSIGYISVSGRVPIERVNVIFNREERIDSRFYIVTFIAIGLSILSVYLFAVQFNIEMNIESISKKRLVSVVDSDGTTVYSSLGYIRILSGFSEIALYFMLAVSLFKNKRLTIWKIFLFAVVFIASCMLPFVASSRTQIGMILLNCLALAYLAGRIKLTYVIPAVLLLGAMVTVMEDLRSEGRRVAEGGTVIDSVVGSGNFFDLARTSALIDRMPEQADYLYGRSYIALLSAPIPRTMWPDKPPVSLGAFVKTDVFGLRTVSGGWPPNIVGEANINFGIVGMIFLMFLYGMFIRVIYNSFEPLIGRRVIPTVLYVCIFWPIGVQLFSLNFALGIATAMQALLPAIVFVILAARPVLARSPSLAKPATSRYGGFSRVGSP